MRNKPLQTWTDPMLEVYNPDSFGVSWLPDTDSFSSCVTYKLVSSIDSQVRRRENG